MNRGKAARKASRRAKRSRSAGGRWAVYLLRPDGDHLVRSGLTFDQAAQVGEDLLLTCGKDERVSLREDWVVTWGTAIHAM
jgi:hypothetical protein